MRYIPTAFTSYEATIHCVGGAHSAFKKQENFRKIPGQANHSFIESLLLETELIQSLNGLVLIGTDAEMREIAEAEIDLEMKLKLLPIKNPEAFKILDTKVGVQSVVQQLKLSAPRALVINNKTDLEKIEGEIALPYFYKGDSGGGGAFIHKVAANEPPPKVSELSYPFLVQEEITGSEISIDAFFVNGILKAYVYSDQIKSIRLYGPSYNRRIARPATEDFLIALQSMGEFTGVYGLVNTTFIFNPELGKHLLLEFDPRPTAWHFLAYFLGINLGETLTTSHIGAVQFPSTHNFRVTLMERFLMYISSVNNPWQLIRAFKDLYSSNVIIMRGNEINTTEALKILIVHAPRYVVFAFTRKLFRLLPSFITTPIKKRGITNLIARRMIGNV